MTDTANRILWTLIGAVVAAAGVCGILIHTGIIRFSGDDGPVLSPELIRLWHRADPWNLVVVAVAGLLVALIGFWLLVRQLRPRGDRRLGDLHWEETQVSDDVSASPTEHLRADPGRPNVNPGRTRVSSAHLIAAWRRDLARGRGISGARTALTGKAARTRAWIRLDLSPGAHVDHARRHVEKSLDRLADTADLRPESIEVTVHPHRGDSGRVT